MEKCSRCDEPHQRLLRVRDTQENYDKLECLDCLAELLVPRIIQNLDIKMNPTLSSKTRAKTWGKD